MNVSHSQCYKKSLTAMVSITAFMLLCNCFVLGSHPKNLAWNGGPLCLKCEHGVDLWSKTGKFVKDNVIAIKAVTYADNIYVISPRMKHGVLATVWLVVRGSNGVELQPFPELRSHEVFDCNAIQNAVDLFLDHLGNLWILDTGIVETLTAPKCTCPSKIVSISIILNKITKRIDLSTSAEPTSLLQNVVVEYGFTGKIFIYVSDASRGAILVYDMLADGHWLLLACPSSSGLQMALVKRKLGHNVLILNRIHHPGLLELDTAVLKGKNSVAALRAYDGHAKPVVLLGSDAHRVYIRHAECSDVLSWDIREKYEPKHLLNVHSAGPKLVPTSVATDPLKHVLLVLDSNYGDTVQGNQATYHKITFIDQH